MVVTVPQARPGDLVYLSIYLEDSSQRTPWGKRWYTVDSENKVTVPLGEDTLPEGQLKLVAQSRTELLGWTKLAGKSPYGDILDKLAADIGDAAGNAAGDVVRNLIVPSTTDVSGTAGRSTSAAAQASTDNTADALPTAVPTSGGSTVEPRRTVQSGGRRTTIPSSSTGCGTVEASSNPGARLLSTTSGSTDSAPVDKPQPNETPRAPASRTADLPTSLRDRISVQVDDSGAYVEVPGGKPGDWVYLYLYAPQAQSIGWAQLDAKRQFAIDLDTLADGDYTMAVLDEGGALVGWTDLRLAGASEADPALVAEPARQITAIDGLIIVAAMLFVEILGIGVGAMLLRRRKATR